MAQQDKFESSLRSFAIAGVCLLIAAAVSGFVLTLYEWPALSKMGDFGLNLGVLLVIPFVIHKALEMTMPYLIGCFIAFWGKR